MSEARTSSGSRAKRIAVAALLLALVVAGAWFWWSRSGGGGEAAAQPQRPPATVAAAPAEQDTWRTQLAAVGTLEAERGVDVTSAAAGIVSAIRFDSGKRVKQGELIAQLDAEADRAQLAALTAQLEQARSDLARNRRLLARQAISAADTEQAATAVQTLVSQVAEQRALIDDKRIEAPFSGELGIRRIDLGQFVQPGQPIVSLQQIEPILVNFALPERHYGQLRPGQPIELRVDAWPEQRFTGTVSAINPQVDHQTRNFQVQGRLPNEERRLRPGMFADLTVTLPQERKVITVPVSAISYSPSGDSVYMLRPPQAASAPGRSASGAARPAQGEPPDAAQGPPSSAAPPATAGSARAGSAGASASQPPVHTVARVLVETGERRGSRIAIAGDIEAGDQVVTAGQLKLFEGAPVVVSAEEVLPEAPSAVSQR